MSKIKIVGGILVAVIILIAAYITSSSLIGKNSSINSVGDNFQETGIYSGKSLPMAASAPSSRSLSLDSTTAYSPEGSASSGSTVTDKKIIKNGSLNLKVNSVNSATEDIKKIAENNNGFVLSTNISQSKNNIKSGYVSVKVPVANFEETITELKKIAALVVREETSGQDVTEEYQDLQAQLKNKQAEEQSFTRILTQAQKIDDILAVTRELSRVRGEIERLEGRIKFISSQADMAQILISLSEDENITISDSWRPLQIAKDAVNSLIKKTQGFVNFLIVLVITVIPIAILYLLLVFILYLAGKKMYGKFRKNKEGNLPPTE